MRKEITDVQLIDDIDGSPATTTIEFSVDGKNYIIDLQAACGCVQRALAPYIGMLAVHVPSRRQRKSAAPLLAPSVSGTLRFAPGHGKRCHRFQAGKLNQDAIAASTAHTTPQADTED